MTRDVAEAPTLIDGLQYCNWSRDIFQQMRQGGMSAVHATVSYHDGFRDTVRNLVEWNWRFRDHAHLILLGRSADDIAAAKASGRTAIFLGLQNPLPIEDDLGLVEILHELGIRFMQLTYNNQSLLGSGWMEALDGGITRMGREVIAEMNRLGIAIDMSHSGERTTLEAIELSTRPVAITHANPSWWRETGRNKSAMVLKALAKTGGMLGLSLYPHHLRQGSATPLHEFCAMAVEVATIVGVDNLGIGSDLCQGQPDNVVQWMREGRWTRSDPRSAKVAFPAQPDWFRDNRDFVDLAGGLNAAGFSDSDIAKVLGENWQNFMRKAFRPGA
jgi:microsomal dipeptidase-like Zn-dependent dipeptidase